MKKWLRLLLMAGVCWLLAGCSETSEEEEIGYQIWYMNQEETKLQYEYRELQSKNTEGLIKEAISVLQEQPFDENLKPVFPGTVQLDTYQLEHNQLYLDFSAEYMDMPKVYEVLFRAAVVRTMCQIPEVDYVGFRVQGQPLLNLKGNAVGLMNEDQFIENAGEEINAYKTADLKLYYANETGDKLIEQHVAMEYNSNISLEKLIVERLILGPPFEGAYPAVPANTKLVNIAVKEDTCYVNLDEGFLEQGLNVMESIPVYSIVNSLIENTNVKKVQISINGETDRVFRENITFNTIFEQKKELVQ